jgi:Toastrack DUF4097
VRRFQNVSIVLVALAVSGTGATLAAQDAPQRQSQRVVAQEIRTEIQRIVQEAVGRDLAREITQEVARTIAEITRELPTTTGGGPRYDAFLQNKDCTAKQTARETKTLALGTTGSLDLKNIVGDIVVKAGGGRDASVEIVRVSCGKTDADAKLGLERVTVDVTSTGDHGSVIAKYPEDRRPTYSVSTAFTVTVPSGTSITARSIAGGIQITGVKGEVSTDSVSGDTTVTGASRIGKLTTIAGKLTLSDVTADGTVEASTVNGVLTLTNVKATRVELGAVTGSVVARGVTAGSAEVNSMSGDIEYSGTLSKSGRYEFQTHSGQITLALGGGFSFEGRSFSGNVVADPSLTQNLTFSAGMRKVARGTIDGGGAVVEATTFSGTVKLGRK